MSIRSRLHRLLLGAPQLRKPHTLGEDTDETTAEVSSMSSSVVSHLDEDQPTHLSAVYEAGDPYADVRERMEELAARDKEIFATGKPGHKHAEPVVPFLVAYAVYAVYTVLILLGHLYDFLDWVRGLDSKKKLSPSDDTALYARLLKSWESFYNRRLYSRAHDGFNRAIASNPGCHIDVIERVSYDHQRSMYNLRSLDELESDAERQKYRNGKFYVETHDGRPARRCLNLGSYNYLGFADDWHTTCGKDVKGSISTMPVSTCSARSEFGTTHVHLELEQTLARFLGKEDALALTMGFNTNATTIPALMGLGDLIISDELNHTSIVNGARGSGAAIRIFRHNDMEQLEEILRETIIKGRPRTRRPWNKIMVIVEGIYSMEGEYCDLKNIVRLCKKYGAYVYLDEAHSIGAMGATGRGISEYCGVDTADIDIMMGTFTKSFGGMGGYIAASKEIIDYLRQRCAGSLNHNSLSPVVCQQVLTAFKVCIHV